MMSWWDYDDVREVDAVAGCFMFVRRDAIDQVGLMDEDYFMYVEEVDWCFRFHNRGWRILFFPGAAIDHFTGRSSSISGRDMDVERRRSLLTFFRKHRGRSAAYVANVMFLLGEAARIVLLGRRGGLGRASGRGDRRTGRERVDRQRLIRFHLVEAWGWRGNHAE
jgi:GT2 family glycosyltransferase